MQATERAKQLCHQRSDEARHQGGPLFGATLSAYATDMSDRAGMAESLRCLMEYICALEARVEALEAQRPETE